MEAQGRRYTACVALVGLALTAAPTCAAVFPDHVEHAHLRGSLSVRDVNVHSLGRFMVDVRFRWFGAQLQSVTVTGRVRCTPLGPGSCIGRRGRVTGGALKPSGIPGDRYEALEDVDLTIEFDDVPLTCDVVAVTTDPMAALAGSMSCRDASGSARAAAFLHLRH